MHRDWYFDGANVFVETYANRIEVSSSDGLPNGLTLADLLPFQVIETVTGSRAACAAKKGGVRPQKYPCERWTQPWQTKQRSGA